MDIHTSSSGLQHIVGYGPQSVVISHPHHNHHHHHPHSRSLPPRSLQKPASSYQLVSLVPVVPTAIYVPVQQQQQRHQPPQIIQDPFHAEQYLPSRGTSATIPKYNSLDDPHMQDYYTRKFGTRPKSATRRSARPDALYRITIKTANIKDAGTNAKVYLSIYGSKDRICRKFLTRETMLRGQTQLSLSLNGLDKISDNDLYNIEFKRGATDIVYIRCRDLGIIHHITLEHTGLLFEQSWLCEFVLITNVRTGRSWLFPCSKWLSLFAPGDGSLSVELYPSDRGLEYESKSSAAPKDTTYDITVITGNQKAAGTDSQVSVTLFGSEGKRSEKIHLKKSNNKNPFERNQTDKFRVKADYVGELVKLRIEHDNTGRLAGWFLDRIVVTDLYDPKTRYFASCNKWLAKDEGDGQISRDLMLKKEGIAARQNTQYKVKSYPKITSFVFESYGSTKYIDDDQYFSR